MDLTSLATIKNICKKYGIKPQRRRGQNFLISKTVLEKIIEKADLNRDDLVLEIGSGLGALTQELARKAKAVLGVEIDPSMTKVLAETVGKYKNVRIIKEDALSKEFYIEFIKWLDKNSTGRTYKIVANLPYNITSAVLRKFLETEPKPVVMNLMVQKEVAQRIIAKPGKMSLLSLSVQFYSRPEIVDYVSKNNFWPAPKVDSALIKLEVGQGVQQQAQKDGVTPKMFFRTAKIGFSAKRKQLQNNLAVGFKKNREEIKEILRKVGLNEKIRAQDLFLKEWIKLTKEITN